MASKNEKVLADAGCKYTVKEFQEMLEDKRSVFCPAWTNDDLLCYPEDAMQFCRMIRRYETCEKLSDYFILKNLLNARKAH